MRALAVAVVLMALVTGGCPPSVGETVTCTEQWVCGGDTDVADSSKAFCTDPGDDERSAQIQQFEKDFGTTCGGAQVQCVDHTFATCVAKCTAKGECDITTAEPVVL